MLEVLKLTKENKEMKYISQYRSTLVTQTEPEKTYKYIRKANEYKMFDI